MLNMNVLCRPSILSTERQEDKRHALAIRYEGMGLWFRPASALESFKFAQALKRVALLRGGSWEFHLLYCMSLCREGIC
jgi:hypothetical protein